ncbi:hypothetical protein Cpa01nite_15770 [Cellulomonas pakistanensis]|uniref:Uncharacterized protein n=1 Tax=Cellulomonas pakistanensis TaxID=992287 RepID=A0A919PAR9_9CELL|nr:hypothetical protein Cpa01nite_15770 [Cellulomonas pakistanensis]
MPGVDGSADRPAAGPSGPAVAEGVDGGAGVASAEADVGPVAERRAGTFTRRTLTATGRRRRGATPRTRVMTRNSPTGRGWDAGPERGLDGWGDQGVRERCAPRRGQAMRTVGNELWP